MTQHEFDRLVGKWLDGQLDFEESARLQEHLRVTPTARARFRNFAKLDAAIRSLATGEIEPSDSNEPIDSKASNDSNKLALQDPHPISAAKPFSKSILIGLALSIALLATVATAAYQIGRVKEQQANAPAKDNGLIASTMTDDNRDVNYADEQTISGHATLRRVAEVKWIQNEPAYRAGDVLPAGIFEFAEGVVEVDVFCGATLIVEGPAKMNLESDWLVTLLQGRLRANVPPAARGFIVKAADAEIIDLGTEFALDVSPDSVQVKVVEGEVKLRGGAHDGAHLLTGQGQLLVGTESAEQSFGSLATIGELQRRHSAEERARFDQWKSDSQRLRKHDRLIAYFPIAEMPPSRFVNNAAPTGANLNGKLIGAVHHSNGRFGPKSHSLGFHRPGSRVRTRIDGEFEAFTFACWAKIDSLDHTYNALFMSDGYENGEPHWQIENSGRLMMSVMVDDTPGSGEGRLPEARLHKLYFTPPIWDQSLSGQWLHIASVYDPAERLVTQYLNGKLVSAERIPNKYFVEKLTIGPAEIGNWGQPFRKSPDFAVRNLNGEIDELAIFNAALSKQEIQNLYKQGKPLGY